MKISPKPLSLYPVFVTISNNFKPWDIGTSLKLSLYPICHYIRCHYNRYILYITPMVHQALINTGIVAVAVVTNTKHQVSINFSSISTLHHMYTCDDVTGVVTVTNTWHQCFINLYSTRWARISNINEKSTSIEDQWFICAAF